MTDIWRRTDQAPENEWVIGYWHGTGAVSLAKYMHETGWIDSEHERAAPPSCWVPMPRLSEGKDSPR